MTETKNLSLKFNEAKTIPEAVEVDTVGTRVSYKGKEDSRVLILLENTLSETTVTAKAGDGIQGVSNLEIKLGDGESAAVVLESGSYMVTSGEDRGYVILTAATAGVLATVIELP